jgi:hypothetical protein
VLRSDETINRFAVVSVFSLAVALSHDLFEPPKETRSASGFSLIGVLLYSTIDRS